MVVPVGQVALVAPAVPLHPAVLVVPVGPSVREVLHLVRGVPALPVVLSVRAALTVRAVRITLGAREVREARPDRLDPEHLLVPAGRGVVEFL